MKGNLQQYRQIAESLHEGIWIIDKDANIIFANSYMAEMLGYTVDEMLRKPSFSFMDECGRAIATRALERRKRGIKEQYDLEFLRKDGTLLHALIAASPVYDEEGNYAGAIAGVLDITERKRLEQALQESERRYRELADFLPQIIFETDEKDNFTFTNQYGFQATGYTQEDFDKGLHALQMVIPEDRERLGENMRRILSGKKSGGNEYTILRKDGTTFPAIIYSAPITRGDKAVGLRGLVVDITEHKKAEESLRQSEARFRSVAETANDGIILINSQAIITFWNHRAETLFGYSGDEIIGKPFTVIIPPRFRADFLEGMERLNLGTDLSVIETLWETLGLRKDGSEFPVEQSLAMWELNGKTFFTSIVRDIAERRTAQ